VTKTAISYTRFSSARQSLGHSEERQIESARAYAKEHGFALQEIVDRGVSAFTGKNVAEGVLGDLLRQVKAGELPKDIVLLVEDPDRISRESWAVVYPKVYEPLLAAGIEIHFLSFRGVLRPNHSFTDTINIGVKHDLGNIESAKKSKRCGKAWSAKRHKANGKAAMSAKVPKWLRAEKGKPITAIPERAAIVRQIFDWASAGLGQFQICDRLIKKKVPAWGPVYQGRQPKWSPDYVRSILASRSVIGEYQPMTKRFDEKKGRKIRVPDGPLVPDYYPAVVPLSLWASVQEARRAFAQVRFGETLNAGRNKFSTANLFRKLVWDTKNDAPMVYHQYDGHPYLVTTHRESLKSHKVAYPWFEKIILNFVTHADWKEIAGQGASPATQELISRRENLAKELDDALKIRSRYESLLDDPEAPTDDRIGEKYKAASRTVKRLEGERSALEAEISSSRNGSELISEDFDLVSIDTQSAEGRTKLRLFLAQRIARIDLDFKATITASDDPDKRPPGVRPGKVQIKATLNFINGAKMYALIDGQTAVILKFPLSGHNNADEYCYD
jgi:DNA invertase Pin-like site-specific DNA recombinase